MLIIYVIIDLEKQRRRQSQNSKLEERSKRSRSCKKVPNIESSLFKENLKLFYKDLFKNFRDGNNCNVRIKHNSFDNYLFQKIKISAIEINKPETRINTLKNINISTQKNLTSLLTTKSAARNKYDTLFRENILDSNFQKSQNIRNKYLIKLVNKNIWPILKTKTHNNIIIFDWDDTLLCTSYLTPNGLFHNNTELTDNDKQIFDKLEYSVRKLLNCCIGKCETYIITNAANGWVEFSSNKYYPEIIEILSNVKIISARGEFEKYYPKDSRQWKIQAFLNLLKTFDYNLVTNLICVGDSFIEMEAGHILASKFKKAFIKTIKFKESPKPEELYKQLKLVIGQFDSIFSSNKNLTIRVEKKVKEKI